MVESTVSVRRWIFQTTSGIPFVAVPETSTGSGSGIPELGPTTVTSSGSPTFHGRNLIDARVDAEMANILANTAAPSSTGSWALMPPA
eukprot:1144448-Prorocentrum_minimum.AAC.1